MGICCVYRKPLSESPEHNHVEDKDCQSSSQPSSTRSKHKYVTVINEASFKEIPDNTINHIYKRDGPDIKISHWTLHPVIHAASGVLGMMKVFKKAELEKRIGLSKFFEGITIQKELDHPHIAKIHELYHDSKHYYLIYDGIRGESLSERIKFRGYLSEEEALVMIRQISAILFYLHKRNVVNRFILPENFFFEVSGNDYTLKLLDFTYAFHPTAEQKGCGKPLAAYYGSPEVLLGEPYDERAEIWSCGVLIYSMFIGDLRVIAGEDGIFEPKTHGLFFERKCWDLVSAEMKDFISKFLKKIPEERITPAELIKSRFLGKQEFAEGSLQKLFLDRLSSFDIKTKLHLLIEILIIERILAPKDKFQYMALFEYFDPDHDAIVKKTDISAKYFKLRSNAVSAQKEIEKIFHIIVFDHMHVISYTRFLSSVMGKSTVITRTTVNKAFKLLDTHKLGYITKEDFAFHMGSNRICSEEWKEMFSLIDTDNDEMIYFEEFSKFMGITPLTQSVDGLGLSRTQSSVIMSELSLSRDRSQSSVALPDMAKVKSHPIYH